ncbi:MAG: ketopantoate reductase family protein [Candidatus Dormibacteria bacterium]
MRFAVVGAGATGGLLGASLARAGEQVTLIARGEHLRAMRARGLRVVGAAGSFTVHPDCTDDLEAVRMADVALLTVKAHSLPLLAPQLGQVLRPGTWVVSAQNGIPWWFFHGWGGELEGVVLETVDPGGGIAASLAAAQVAGSVVYPAARIPEPGVVEHHQGRRISLGAPGGGQPEGLREVAAALVRAGFRTPLVARLRPEIWLKLLGNATLNPISALTGATLGEITGDPGAAELVRGMMEEAELVGRRLGLEIPVSIDRRIRGAAAVGDHKTSMLQDVEAGRPLEIGATLGALVELADRLGLGATRLRALLACARLLDTTGRRRQEAASGS